MTAPQLLPTTQHTHMQLLQVHTTVGSSPPRTKRRSAHARRDTAGVHTVATRETAPISFRFDRCAGGGLTTRVARRSRARKHRCDAGARGSNACAGIDCVRTSECRRQRMACGRHQYECVSFTRWCKKIAVSSLRQSSTPFCDTVTLCPAIVTVPLRCPSRLIPTATFTVPLPLPDPPDVMEIHDA